VTPVADNGVLIQDSVTKSPKPAFPLVAFLLPAKGTVSQWLLLPLILMVVGLYRWATGFWGYSGVYGFDSMILPVIDLASRSRKASYAW